MIRIYFGFGGLRVPIEFLSHGPLMDSTASLAGFGREGRVWPEELLGETQGDVLELAGIIGRETRQESGLEEVSLFDFFPYFICSSQYLSCLMLGLGKVRKGKRNDERNLFWNIRVNRGKERVLK